MKQTRLIFVGGFLGAGKTTLLYEASKLLIEKGKQTGLITNDQAPELVDTALLSKDNVKVKEVSGSCFCCNFTGLVDAIKHIRNTTNAEVIIAEPVGSCTDLSATILQPLKQNFLGELIVSPLSVLADPFRLNDILNGGNAGLHPSAAYILRKQLEESDIILITKSDLIEPEELNILKEKVQLNYPVSEVMTISSLSGEGIDLWLNAVMTRNDAGKRLAKVDYDIYAEGEAVLGWLNGTIDLRGEMVDWDAYLYGLIDNLNRQFNTKKVPVGHVKILLEAGDKYSIANLTGLNSSPSIRSMAGTGNNARLTLNARVEMDTNELDGLIRGQLKKSAGKPIQTTELAWRCLSPGRPNPTFRFKDIVPVFDL